MITISKMTHRIVLLEPVEDYDYIRGKDGDYVERGEVWAEFLKAGFVSREVYGNDAAVVVTQGIRLRPVSVSKGWRVRDVASGKVYEVQHVDAGSKSEIILTTWEVEM